MRNLLVVVHLLLFCAGSAQTCCSGGVPLSNNLGLPNEVKGTLLLGLNYDYNNLSTLNSGSEKLDDDSRQRITNSMLLNIGYSITDRFSGELLFTRVHQTRTITQFGNKNFSETSGIGDAVFLLKYAIPNFISNNGILTTGLGIKAPLGVSDAKNEQGILHTADLQPGSGAWDGLAWLSFSENLGFRPSAQLIASTIYRFTGKNNSYLNNSAVYEFGNAIQSNLGYVDQILVANTIVNPGLVIKYRKSKSDQIDGSNIPNTGGEWIFVRPEIGVQITPRLAFDARLEIPVYSHVDGTQLTPTIRFTAGVFFTLRKNKGTILN